ncbi:hypothetical protein PHLCEN_2v2371 [Hermanssonia centrifuga]|uniref:Uncharacterized protein n=1 Tax=Hermanssonia centrifuga TaxID=98765 RepID=A0A2R6RM09_9APHY|nr:hypothetical protein PHLCEN_2v2371 [Hermanssonia centrifuga]
MPPDLPLDIVPLILQHLCRKPLIKEWRPFHQAEDPFSPDDLPDEGQLWDEYDVSWKYDLFSFSLCSHAMRRVALPFIFERMDYRFMNIWHNYPVTLKIADEQDPSIISTPARPKGPESSVLQDLYEFMAITPHIAGVVKNLRLQYAAEPCYEDTPGQEREIKSYHIDIRDLGKLLDLFGCLRSLELLGVPIDVPQSYHILETRGRAIDRLSFNSSHECTYPPTISFQPYLAPLLLFDRIKKLVLDYSFEEDFYKQPDRPVYFPFPGESLVVMCSPGLVGPVLERLAETDASRTETHLKSLKVCELTHSNLRPLNKLLSRFGASLVELDLEWVYQYGCKLHAF